MHLRIEGLDTTIYEAPIFSGPRNITTPSGGTHLCDGTNNDQNPSPVNTPTAALDAASKIANFQYDGTYSEDFEDYFITSIGPDTQTATQFWGVLVNYVFTPVGGCQFALNQADEVLWAFDAFNKKAFLKVEPSRVAVRQGKSVTVKVTDGASGIPVAGAVIDGVTTDENGDATLTFEDKGLFTLKATKADAVRSNALRVFVA